MPLEHSGRLIGGNSTPRLAKMTSWKYSKLSARAVAEDFRQNHQRAMSPAYVQKIAADVADIARENETEWTYALPPMPSVVSHIAIGRDGTTTPIIGEGYREAMNGTIALYNRAGERMHTIYVTVAPEYGKATFDETFTMEIERIKQLYPDVGYVGLGDGAQDNWPYLALHTSVSILDFYHASGYLATVSGVMAASGQTAQAWFDDACDRLKHDRAGANDLLKEMRQRLALLTRKNQRSDLETTITYFTNNLSRMKYASYTRQKYPIGSGVTEAACKIMVKQRLCGSGMRWTHTATDNMFLLRGLTLTNGRWEQFWQHIDQLGF